MKDLSGKTYNMLTAISPIGLDKSRCVVWKFSCVCGNVVNKRGTLVTSGGING